MKKFKEFLNKESYDGGNFVGLGGFSIGSLDSFKPIASLGPSDRPPNMNARGDKRGTTANMPNTKLKRKKSKTTDIEPVEGTALYKHLEKKGLVKKEDKEMEKFMDDLANNTPNADMFDELHDEDSMNKSDLETKSKELEEKIIETRKKFYKNLKKV